MQVIHSLQQMQAISSNWAKEAVIGFVPTMGYLHQGHLSLVAASLTQCDVTVVSIYVNPSQFGENEDFGSYPKDLNLDLELLNKQGVDYVFCPESKDMYPSPWHTWINVEQLSSVLCGASRPGHFKGVATIVAKLTNLVQPKLIFMGEKDFQQVTVLKTMFRELNMPCEIISCPIVREPDGLAMSSRNVYLSATQRQQALCLSQAIVRIKQLYQQGERCPNTLIEDAKQLIASMGGKVDYLSLINPNSLQDETDLKADTRIILAVYIGKTRLIDNSPIA